MLTFTPDQAHLVADALCLSRADKGTSLAPPKPPLTASPLGNGELRNTGSVYFSFPAWLNPGYAPIITYRDATMGIAIAIGTHVGIMNYGKLSKK